MTEKEIKKLNRQDLLILLAEQKERVDILEGQLKSAEEKLENRRLLQEESGSMAEAALRFHDVFRAVDEAAALFAENVRLRQQEQDEAFLRQEAENTEKAEQILRSARQEAENTKLEAEQVLQTANEQASRIIAQAEADAGLKKQESEQALQDAREQAGQIVAQAKEDAEERKLESEVALEDANEQARQIIARAKTDAAQTVQKANEQAAQIIAQAEAEADQQAQRAEEIIRQAQAYVADEMEKIEMRWAEIHEKIESMSQEYIWLRGIINREDDTPRQKAGQIIQDAQMRAQEIVSQAQEQAAMEMEKIDSRWNGIYDRIRGMEKEYSWLQGIINTKAGESA